MPPQPTVPDLEKYERTPEEPDDFRHRMMMNGLGLVVTVVLIAGGLWIAEVMAHMRKDQDCALTGRSNCMPVELPLDRALSARSHRIETDLGKAVAHAEPLRRRRRQIDDAAVLERAAIVDADIDRRGRSACW